jgi:hypothetical protein
MILVCQVFVIEYANVSAIRHHLQTNQWFPDNPGYSFAQYSLVVSRAGGFILAFLHVKTGELPRAPIQITSLSFQRSCRIIEGL